MPKKTKPAKKQPVSAPSKRMPVTNRSRDLLSRRRVK